MYILYCIRDLEEADEWNCIKTSKRQNKEYNDTSEYTLVSSCWYPYMQIL